MAETLGTAILELRTDGTALRAGIAGARASAKRLGQDFRRIGRGLSLGLTLPIVGIGVAVLKTAGQFEKGMNQVQALTGATEKQFSALEEQAKELGATTQFSAGQAADAMGFLAQSGMDANEIIGSMPATLNLAAAAQTGLAETADMVTNIMKGYGREVEQTIETTDILTGTFTRSNTNLTQLSEAMKLAGPVAAGFGLQFEETAALLGLMGNAGFQASLAGTALRGALIRLANPAAENARLIEDLGLKIFDAKGNMVPFISIVEQLESAGITTAETMKLFGQRAGPAMAALLSQGSQALKDFTTDLENSAGTTERIAKVQMEGLIGQLRALRSAVEAVAIEIAQAGLLKWATDLAQSMARFFRELAKVNPEILKWASGIALVVAAAGPAVIVLGFLLTAVGALLTPIGAVAAALIGAGGAVAAFFIFQERITAIWNELFSLAGIMALVIDTFFMRVRLKFLEMIFALIESSRLLAKLFGNAALMQSFIEIEFAIARNIEKINEFSEAIDASRLTRTVSIWAHDAQEFVDISETMKNEVVQDFDDMTTAYMHGLAMMARGSRANAILIAEQTAEANAAAAMAEEKNARLITERLAQQITLWENLAVEGTADQFARQRVLESQAFAQRMATAQGNNLLEEALFRQHEANMTAIAAKEAQARFAAETLLIQQRTRAAITFFGGFAALAQSFGGRYFNWFKSLAKAEAIANAVGAASLAMRTIPWPFSVAVAAGVYAQGIARFRQISALQPPTYHLGGLVTRERLLPVPGRSGGEGLALLQEGERVLPRGREARNITIALGGDDDTVFTRRQVRSLLEAIKEEMADDASTFAVRSI